MMMFLAAFMAILVPLVLIVGFRMSAKYGMLISFVIVAMIALSVWHMEGSALVASVLQAIHRALTIALILLGAVTLLYTLQRTGAMERIKHGFHAISLDMRVQAVLVGFVFISLIEGASGFGTPAIVAAPLLMALGFRPIVAASLALLGDTVAVTFGAVGTPLIVGLENLPQYSTDLVWQVGAQVTIFDLVIGVVVPMLLVTLLVVGFRRKGERPQWRYVWEMAPWVMLVSCTYTFSAFAAVRLFGAEFTAIIGALVALIVAVATARKGILLPKTIWRHHAAEDVVAKEELAHKKATMNIMKAWLPYGVVVVLLLLTRAVEPVKDFTTTVLNISWTSILGYDTINSTWQLLYSPGMILLVAASIAALVQRRSIMPMFGAMRQSVGVVTGALLALVPTLMMVQIFSNSGNNTAELASMPVFIGESFAAVFGSVWVVAAPLLGAIGAFIAGSSTVSALTLAVVQDSAALSVGLPQQIVLALHMIGAAAGNVVAIHNVVAAAAVVGLVHREGLIMRHVFSSVVVYLAVAALLGGVAFVAVTLVQ
ncbi:MAG: L-lactate permease [Candidatus Saccharimonadales bacterium]